jgi:ribosomal protein L14
MFDIKKSKKASIEGDEHYIVVKDGVVYLRIISAEGGYATMTATAAEDNGKIVAFRDQAALIKAALKAAKNEDIPTSVKYDCQNREYVELGKCEYISDAHRLAEKLFKILAEGG